MLCCGPDAAQAGTANSPWPRSSRASCFSRVVKSELTFKQQLNPGGFTAAVDRGFLTRGWVSCKSL